MGTEMYVGESTLALRYQFARDTITSQIVHFCPPATKQMNTKNKQTNTNENKQARKKE